MPFLHSSRLHKQTNRQTDHANIRRKRQHLAMRPKNIATHVSVLQFDGHLNPTEVDRFLASEN